MRGFDKEKLEMNTELKQKCEKEEEARLQSELPDSNYEHAGYPPNEDWNIGCEIYSDM